MIAEFDPLLVAGLGCALLTPVVMRLAQRRGWLAPPRRDRWSSRPTALMGGFAIAIAVFIGVGLGRASRADAVILAGALLLFGLGWYDDRRGVRPHIKVLFQVVAACFVYAYGIRFAGVPAWASLPLTLLWVIAVVNAVNLLDNMDGLAAGTSAISALFLAGSAHLHGDPHAATLPLALAGACLGFLIYNFNPARIFMGDCGSLFIGFILACSAIAGHHRSAPNTAIALLVPVLVLAIPIFDTTLVSIVRTLAGRSLIQGGRDHSSHRLVVLGLSERATVVAFYCATAVFASLALATMRWPLMTVGVVAAMLFLALAMLGVCLGKVRVYTDQDAPPQRHETRFGGALLHKKQILQLLADLALVPIALVSAHLLRFDGVLPAEIGSGIQRALPVVIVAKLGCLAAFRAHRGVWRYAGLDDVLRAAIGSACGSLVAAALIAVILQFEGVSRAALINDWLLYTCLVVASRSGMAVFRHSLRWVRQTAGDRALIIGAAPQAVAAAEALSDPMSRSPLAVVGFVSDDRSFARRSVNGVPVLGNLSELEALLTAHGIEFAVLGPWSTTEERRAVALAAERGAVALIEWGDSARSASTWPARTAAIG